MEYLFIPLMALLASGLTLFSGFDLGTLLMPVFALFFPVTSAIAMTAVVHLANNLFKLLLLVRFARWDIALRFGVPAVLAAFGGAWLLQWLAQIPALHQYTLFGRTFNISPVKLVIAVLLIVFALLDILPRLRNLTIGSRWLIPGGLLSGFFGGLSGHQGALRSTFLVKTDISKEAFIATGVLISTGVDLTRLGVYGPEQFRQAVSSQNALLVVLAVLAAFAGALLGRTSMKKVTFRSIQLLIGILLILVALALAAGLIG